MKLHSSKLVMSETAYFFLKLRIFWMDSFVMMETCKIAEF